MFLPVFTPRFAGWMRNFTEAVIPKSHIEIEQEDAKVAKNEWILYETGLQKRSPSGGSHRRV